MSNVTATSAMRRLAAAVLCLSWLLPLSGCAMIPAVVKPVTWIVAGVSYVTTSKGPSDHARSIVTKKDCSLFRLLTQGRVCVPVNAETNEPLIVHIMRMLHGGAAPAPALPGVALTAAAPEPPPDFPENPLLRPN